MASQLWIGLPKIYASKGNKCVPPTNSFILGTWHVTHSSLPLWQGKRNVNITYDTIPSNSSRVTQVGVIIKYQAIDSDKIKSVHGVDTPTPGNPGAWDFRGRGWLLMIASSHWECLGFGHEDNNQWIVTYFTKTHFTPAGIDICSRHKEGLLQGTIDGILKAVKELGVDEITKLASNIIQIRQDV
jgi:hypothetical protein